ncbi:MAG: aldose epimerase family protein [Spirochaetaceae bacterium]
MTIEKQAFGESPEGPVERITIVNQAGVSVSAMTYGAIITSVLLPDAAGHREEVTLGFDELESYLGRHPYFGATVGRVCNRIAGASFSLDGKRYPLEANEGGNTLHGGTHGFHRKLWTADVFGESDEAGVIFRCTSPDGEAGFPGTLSVSVRLSLNESNELRLRYEAATDKATPVSLTNHAYWNLSARPEHGVLDHQVLIDPDHYLPTDAAQIPTGQVLPVAGTPHDFRNAKPVGRDIGKVEGGFDECYLFGADLDSALQEATMGSETMRRCARVVEPGSRRTMEIHSTMPGLQFYTGNKLDGAPARDGGSLHAHAAMCFETQFLPNAVNEPAFPSPILRPGDTYRHETVHIFGTE